jgi:hypothetical protein
MNKTISACNGAIGATIAEQLESPPEYNRRVGFVAFGL